MPDSDTIDGLDKAARLARERAEAEEEGRPPALNPAFPYLALAFPARFFEAYPTDQSDQSDQ